MRPRALRLALLVFLASLSARAQTGVSSDRISLPDGPGSITGVGENVSVDGNMGMMHYGVSVEVPEGYPGMTPQVALTYGSGGGAGLVGMGWDVSLPSIERMTSRGVPEYKGTDLFAANGGEQLVQTDPGEPATYRARMEKGFVRYRWHARTTGAEGHWTAEYPDGRIAYFGADQAGRTIAEAREGGTAGTFRWHVVDVVDVWGHTIHYTWTKAGTVSLPASIGWVYANGTPRFEIAFDFEDRPDHVSDCKGGYESVLQKRLSQVRVRSNGSPLQAWKLTYEANEQSGGLSRLVRVERFGQKGTRYPVAFDFSYSRAVAGVCSGAGCNTPFLVHMGSLGLNMKAGSATLVDMNGDALPDVVDTAGTGAHHIFLSHFVSPTNHTFLPATTSQVGTGSAFALAPGSVQELDANGDGFADLLNTKTGQMLENKGTGDWSRVVSLFQSSPLPDLAADLDPGDGDLATIRFLDADDDKKIDLIKSSGAGALNQTTIYRNTGTGFVLQQAQPIGVGFESNTLQLEDINGDGLLDPVQLRAGALSYRLNLGRGTWTEWRDVTGLPFTDAELPFVELEDMNNDGFADLVIVKPDQVRYALGRNGTGFDAVVTLDSAALGSAIPERKTDTTVLFADMNGSGSSDVVWIDGSGNVTYLELFPVQPHLLSRITNAIGMVSEITYGTSVQQAALDEAAGRPWSYKLAFPMSVVTQVDVSDALSGVHEVMRYRYWSGFYDGAEKQFRGYARVEVTKAGDDAGESGLTRTDYDVGVSDPYRAGLLLSQEQESDGKVLSTATYSFADCPLDALPTSGLSFPIRYVCPTGSKVVIKEGADPTLWVTTETKESYDGWGNVTREENLGTTAIGGGSCAPCTRAEGVQGQACGPACEGDELVTLTDYVPPTNTHGLWIIGKPSRIRRSGRLQGGAFTEREIHYDGSAFEGLDPGELTKGFPTRILERTSAQGDWVTVTRARIDAHGHAVEAIDPTGSEDVPDENRATFTYDALGLRITVIERRLKDPEGQPYVLRQELTSDPAWNRDIEATEWMVVKGGRTISTRNTAAITLDEFGRQTSRFEPGDAPGAPTEKYTYELSSPVSRIVTDRKSVAGGAYDIRHVRCLDGFGRTVQERVRAQDGEWIVSGYVVYNKNGSVRRSYDAWRSASEACDTGAPTAVPFQDLHADAIGRGLGDEWVFPGSNETWARKTQYLPSETVRWGLNDLDPTSAQHDTPDRYEHDGLGRDTRVVRALSATQTVAYTFTYDELGRYRGYVDPAGHEKVQTYDLLGRLVRIDDPDRGTSQFTYDAAGHALTEVDGAGVEVRNEYDGLGRIKATYDAAHPAETRVEYRYDQPKECPADKCTNTAGRLVEVSYPLPDGSRGSLWSGYEPTGRPTYTGRTVLGRRFDFADEVDLADRIVSRTFPDGTQLKTTWDGASRPMAIAGVLDTIVYDAKLHPTELKLANGVRDQRTYDLLHRMTARDLTDRAGKSLLGRDWTYDREGNVLSVADRVLGDGPSANATYGYDGFSRLTQATMDTGRAYAETLAVAYDALGNITSKTSSLGEHSRSHVGSYTYGESGAGPHAVTHAGSRSYAYDRAGRMTQRGGLTLTWDSRGNLTEVKDAANNTVERNVYGAGTQRVLRITDQGTTWYLGEEFEIRDGIASTYAGIAGETLARIDSTALMTTVLTDLAPLVQVGGKLSAQPDGKITAADGWAAQLAATGHAPDGMPAKVDLPKPLLRAAARRLLVGERRTVFLHGDGAHSVVATTDGDGKLLESAQYDPFGQQRGTGALSTSARSYDGKEVSDRTGLSYFGARHFDTQLGRWISPDPAFAFLENPGFHDADEEAGAYAGMRNNPVRFSDRNGMIADPISLFVTVGWGMIGGAVVGAIDSMLTVRTESEMLGTKPTWKDFALWGAAGALQGAISGATTYGVGQVSDLGLSSAVDKHLWSRHLAGQNRVTANRMTRDVTSTLISVGVLLLFAAGGAVPVVGIALTVGLGVAKLLYHLDAHRYAKGKWSVRGALEPRLAGMWGGMKEGFRKTKDGTLRALGLKEAAWDPKKTRDNPGEIPPHMMMDGPTMPKAHEH